MGLQMPAVSDPLYTYSLGPFRGVVRSPQEPRWLDGTADGWGLDLMKEGKFKAAGKLLAKGFRDTDVPRYPLVLAEALFALGKFEHADLRGLDLTRARAETAYLSHARLEGARLPRKLLRPPP